MASAIIAEVLTTSFRSTETSTRKGDSFFMYSIEDVRKEDPQIAELIEAEVRRQNSHIELIASENWVSHAVMAAMGSPLTNKYAAGHLPMCIRTALWLFPSRYFQYHRQHCIHRKSDVLGVLPHIYW